MLLQKTQLGPKIWTSCSSRRYGRVCVHSSLWVPCLLPERAFLKEHPGWVSDVVVVKSVFQQVSITKGPVPAAGYRGSVEPGPSAAGRPFRGAAEGAGRRRHRPLLWRRRPQRHRLRGRRPRQLPGGQGAPGAPGGVAPLHLEHSCVQNPRSKAAPVRGRMRPLSEAKDAPNPRPKAPQSEVEDTPNTESQAPPVRTRTRTAATAPAVSVIVFRDGHVQGLNAMYSGPSA